MWMPAVRSHPRSRAHPHRWPASQTRRQSRGPAMSTRAQTAVQRSRRVSPGDFGHGALQQLTLRTLLAPARRDMLRAASRSCRSASRCRRLGKILGRGRRRKKNFRLNLSINVHRATSANGVPDPERWAMPRPRSADGHVLQGGPHPEKWMCSNQCDNRSRRGLLLVQVGSHSGVSRRLALNVRAREDLSCGRNRQSTRCFERPAVRSFQGQLCDLPVGAARCASTLCGWTLGHVHSKLAVTGAMIACSSGPP